MGTGMAEDNRDLSLRVVLLPRDSNETGSIFGGVLLSHIDLAAAVAARMLAHMQFVTVAMDKIDFKKPVFVGDLVSFYTTVLKVGRTSVQIRVDVEARRRTDYDDIIKVTEAIVTMVAVDEDRLPTPIRREEDSSTDTH